MGPTSKKRAAPATSSITKKQKLDMGHSFRRGLPKPDRDKRENAFRREYIAIPGATSDNDARDDCLSEHDMVLLDEFGDSVNFLAALDHQSIARNRKETKRLHQLDKPVRKPRVDDLPSVDSHDEGSEPWDTEGGDSDMETQLDVVLSNQADFEDQSSFPAELDSDMEMPYERVSRPHKVLDPKILRNIPGLPIKLSNGRIQASNKVTTVPIQTRDEDAEGSNRSQSPRVVPLMVEDITTGARFGRVAVAEVIGNSSRKVRIQGAKDQIASICQEIIADPENSLGLLRRLHTFSLDTITVPSRLEPVRNDVAIRKLAILSQLAVFKDIIPGYRIRVLTDKEKGEKVNQVVARTREWEQGLVLVYQTYLRALEAELKAKSDLADVALKCMCTLASDVTHFNFRVNLLTCVVTRLSKKTWDESSDLCLNTLINVFRNDLTGIPSLEAMQLLNRMIKERHFNVHPEVLTCLLHLRLKSELGVRASESRADREERTKGKPTSRKANGKTGQRYLSKKGKKALKEREEIEREVREAEAEVDKEERARTHTETLKLLFVLYFRILKNPHPTPLLPAALRGISKYAHLVNIDFFRDLMQVLKSHTLRESTETDSDDLKSRSIGQKTDVQHRLLCIVTAFELLSGQGEALNIDLGDFIDHLYAIILPTSELLQMDESWCTSGSRTTRQPTIADMLFRALTIVFSTRSAGSSLPWRSAAFSKRLLIASLNWPPAAALRALEFVEGLVMKEPKLEALLSTDDRHVDGVYLPQVDDPQLSHPFETSFFELLQLQQRHYDSRIRESARRLSSYTRK